MKGSGSGQYYLKIPGKYTQSYETCKELKKYDQYIGKSKQQRCPVVRPRMSYY
jgi:hypothetical protein